MPINLAQPTQNAPREWLENQRQVWLREKVRMEAEMMQLIDDHAACMTNLAACDRLLSLHEDPPLQPQTQSSQANKTNGGRAA